MKWILIYLTASALALLFVWPILYVSGECAAAEDCEYEEWLAKKKAEKSEKQ